jgi:Fe-only nitrogenase accessory protein AnfO
MRIATYVNEYGEVVSFYRQGCVRLYENKMGIWSKIKELPLDLTPELSLPEVRIKLKSIVGQLDNCKVFLAGEVKGVPYAILEGMGFNIWKSEGSVSEQLDYVSGKENEAIEAAKKPKPEPMPVGDLRDGLYRINLTEVLSKDPNLSSKQILIPFMENTTFQKLEIFCDHPPRWLSTEFERLKMSAEAEALDKSGHELKITVCPRN